MGNAITLDIRLPIGVLFLLFGLIIAAAGVAPTGPAAMLLGLDANLAWGGVLAAFGAFMLLLAWRSRSHARRLRR